MYYNYWFYISGDLSLRQVSSLRPQSEPKLMRSWLISIRRGKTYHKSLIICYGDKLEVVGLQLNISVPRRKPYFLLWRGTLLIDSSSDGTLIQENAPRRYENAEVALNTGMILREMLRHEPLARILLYSDRWAFSSLLLKWFSVTDAQMIDFIILLIILSKRPLGLRVTRKLTLK